MFTLNRLVGAITMPVSILYVDAPNTPYTFTNIILHADDAIDSLTVDENVNLSFTVGGTTYATPLAGTDFLTAQTGTLTATVILTADPGQYIEHLYTTVRRAARYGLGRYGAGRYGAGFDDLDPLSTILQVQVLAEAWASQAVPVMPNTNITAR